MRSGPKFFPVERHGARVTSSIADALAELRVHVREKVLRSACHAGAVVLYDELKTRAPSRTGGLKAAVYRWHDDKKSRGGERQVYYVGVNKAKAPHWALVEYGHMRINVVFRGADGELVVTKKRLPAPVWVPPNPYLRPTWDAKASEAIEAMKARAAQRIAEFKQTGALA